MRSAPNEQAAYLDLRQGSRQELVNPGPQHLLPGAQSFLNIAYAWPHGFRPLLLDLHIPDGAAGAPVPVVVYAHGGGFFGGSKAMGPWAFLLTHGYAVASVDYRLYGEAQFPGPVRDVADAVRWIRLNARKYGLDAGRIAGLGSSAGGYLMSMVALAAGSPEIVGGQGADVSCELNAVIEHYAPVDFLTIGEDEPNDVVEKADSAGSSPARFLGHLPKDNPERSATASCLGYVGPSSPPFLIIHGDSDRRVGIGQSLRLRDALVRSGGSAELWEIRGGDHGTAEFDEADVHARTISFLTQSMNRRRAASARRQS